MKSSIDDILRCLRDARDTKARAYRDKDVVVLEELIDYFKNSVGYNQGFSDGMMDIIKRQPEGMVIHF